MWAMGSLAVSASESKPTGLGSMPDTTKYPPSTHEFHAKIVEVEIGSVAIYRPFGKFHRANSYYRLSVICFQEAFLPFREGDINNCYAFPNDTGWQIQMALIKFVAKTVILGIIQLIFRGMATTLLLDASSPGKSGRKGDPEQRVRFQTEGIFLADVRGKKAPRNGLYVRFKADRTTSKRIRYGFITVKSTTLIVLNSPRKNTTLPAIRSVEPRRTHIPV
ncbi:hypothetical protein TNCV_4806351 [Trichonephila clavipes]|nr:hypothetical protein TNCV_4806351 [Trichonephila clavipes]